MKVLITGDWQLESAPPCDRRDKRGRSIRFEENVQTILKMVHDAKAVGCERMVFLGDLTEERNPDSKTLDGAAEIFSLAMDQGMAIDAIAGNHDGAIYDISSSSLEALGKTAGENRMKVWHKVGVQSFDGYHFMFVPYIHEATPEQIKKLIEDALEPLEGDVYLFGHYGAKLSKIGAKNMAMPGDYLDAETLLASHFKRIYMGHIHKGQSFVLGKTPFRHPGSPYICDHGESEDPKGYSILDTTAGTDTWTQIKPKRQWLTIDYRKLMDAENDYVQGGDGPVGGFPMPWTENDIVKFVGEYSVGETPKEAIRLNFKNGSWTPEPFFKTIDLKRKREDRTVRDGANELAEAGGFAEAVAMFVAKKWPDHPLAAQVLKLILDELKDSKPTSLDRVVVPTRIEVRDFMSHKHLDHDFFNGQPELIIGPNGLGKTNIMEALLFALTGQTSKPIKKNAGLVRQQAKKASVTVYLRGDKNIYRIIRTLTLGKATSHKVKVEIRPIDDIVESEWKSLADGGVNDTQEALSAVIGATYKSLKATNFMFQKDRSPVVETDPADRKSILGEIFGFEPIAKAFKKLEEKRQAASRLVNELKARLQGLHMAWDPAKEEATKATLAQTQANLPAAKTAVEAAQKRWDEAETAAKTAVEALMNANNDLQALPDSSGLLTGAENELKTLEDSFNKERDRRKETYISDRNSIAAIKASIMALDMKAMNARAEELTASKAGFQKTIDEKTPEIQKLADIKTAARTNLEVLDREHAGFGREIEGLKTNDIGKCSKCGQPIDSGHIEKEIADLTAKAKANREACAAHNIAIQDADKAMTPLVDAKVWAEGNLKSATTEMEVVVGKVATAQSQIAELDRLEKRFSETEDQGKKALTEFEAKKEGFKKKIDDLKVVCDQESAIYAEKEKRKEDVQGQVTAKTSETSDAVEAHRGVLLTLVTLQNGLEATQAVLQGFQEVKAKTEATEREIAEAEKTLELRVMASQALDPKAGGLPVWLIDARLPELEDSINQYMDLFNAGGLSVQLSTVTEDGAETLDVLIDNGMEPMLDIANYSGGQLDRIEICLKHALADLAESMRDVRLGLLAYDEPGVYLDEERKSKLIEVVHERCTSGRNPVTMVISHDRKMISGFRRRLAIRQDDERTVLDFV